MRAIWFLVLLLFTGTACFMYLGYSSKGTTALYPVMDSIGNRNAMTLTVKSRKLKDNFNPPSQDEDNEGYANLEDYRPIDPVPNWKASIRPGPIQHEAPLMPYIPQPAPPPIQQKHDYWYP